MNSFICPKCGEDLLLNNKSFICKNKHCYDKAKEGYVNLLPINSKKSKEPGDNAKMMMARREFLQTDFYKPLANKISFIIKNQLHNKKSNILDLGCGEGYYTGLISKELKNSTFSALDISKIAVKYASKQYKNINFCVASAFKMPIKDNSIDLLYRIYAPSLESELQRVIKKNGYLLTVTPGDRHLYQLREVIYEKVLNLSTKEDESKTLIKINSENLKFNINIKDPKVLQTLLDMTPFSWKITNDIHTKLFSNTEWNIECDFKISLYKNISN